MVIQIHNLCLDDRIIDGCIAFKERILEDEICMNNNIYTETIKVSIGARGFILMEDGSYILMEDGSNILKE